MLQPPTLLLAPRSILEQMTAPSVVVPLEDDKNTKLLSLAVGVVVVAALYIARDILIPIAMAILLSFVLAPLVRVLRRARLGRAPAVVLAVTLALGIIGSLAGLLGAQVAGIVEEIPRYSTTIEEKFAGLRTLTTGRFVTSMGAMGKRIQQVGATTAPPDAGTAVPHPPVSAEPKPVAVEVHQPEATSLEITERLVIPVIAPLLTAGIVFIMAIFILLQRTDLRDRFIRLFGLKDQHRMSTVLDDAGTRLSHYLLTLLGLNVAFGLMMGAGLLLIGVPNAVLWATLAGLLRFVPYFGTLIAGILPTLFAAAVDPGWSLALLTAGLFIVGETMMGQVIDPLVYGRTTGLTPVSVVVATIFWSWMWGPVGLILSMPLTLCLVVVGRHVQQLEFLVVLMGDRPPLTPIEGFYQRILANDLDETLEHAESFLKDHPLAMYYDEVAIMGLRMAAHDSGRGVLTSRQLLRIQLDLPRLFLELGDTVATTPPPAEIKHEPGTDMHIEDDSALGDPTMAAQESFGSILCISGRDILDQPVTLMLTQMLEQNGMSARIATYEAASRDEIASLDVTGVGAICIVNLELTGSPSHLRYLIRRIRGRIPTVPILVGLLPGGEVDELLGERLRSVTGADDYTASLADFVKKCQNTLGTDLPP